MSNSRTCGGVGRHPSSSLGSIKCNGEIQEKGRWVPHKLRKENKQRRIDICLSLLSQFKRKHFLHNIITGDKKWILYDNPKHRKTWVNPGHQREQLQNQIFMGRKCAFGEIQRE